LAKELGKSLSEVKALSSTEIVSWMAYYSDHPMREQVDRNEWAYTRQVIMNASGRYKPVKADDLVLKFGKRKEQTQAEIDRNLGLVKAALSG
jgi:hypothetical protein